MVLKISTFDTGSSALAHEQMRRSRRRSFPWMFIAHMEDLFEKRLHCSSISVISWFSRLSPCIGSTSCYVASVSSANLPEQTWKLHCAERSVLLVKVRRTVVACNLTSGQWEGGEFGGPMGGQEVDNKIWRSSDQTLGPHLADPQLVLCCTDGGTAYLS